MKNSIISTGGRYSTSRMVVDYTNNLYIPLCEQYNKYYSDLETVMRYNEWKKEISLSWDKIEISQEENINNMTLDAGNNIEVQCKVKLPNINVENIEVQAYYGKILDNGVVENIVNIPMELVKRNDEEREYEYKTKIELVSGGNYGYTFRVIPKHEMLLEPANLNLIKWITK